MTVVTANGLSAGYDGKSVLSNLNFSIPGGQRVALLGPNGGGKSTLIRTLSGELQPIGGTFAFTGQVGLVPQGDSGRLDWPATALDVAICGTLDTLPWWRRPGRQQRAAALAALESVGLAKQAGVKFGDLSGGQRRRARVAAALAGGGDVLLLDEPFAGLDAVSSEQLEDLITELARSGKTLLIATHDLDQAKSWELVLCLNQQQVAFGAPDQVLTKEALVETFGSDLLELPDGGFMAPPHHHHDH
jgi:manganese/iron transport system ATP-binding protein/manganese/zinc/iron transport system ATP- binding protein